MELEDVDQIVKRLREICDDAGDLASWFKADPQWETEWRLACGIVRRSQEVAAEFGVQIGPLD